MNKSDIKLIPVPKEVVGTGEMFEIDSCIICEFPRWKQLLEVAKASFEKIFDRFFE